MTDMVMEPQVKATAKVVEPTIFDLSSPGRTGVTDRWRIRASAT